MGDEVIAWVDIGISMATQRPVITLSLGPEPVTAGNAPIGCVDIK